MSNVTPPADPLRRGATTNSKIVMPRMIRRAAMALALAGVAAFGAIVYGAYKGAPTSPDDVPLITADSGALRERPLEEGGMQIANRDSTVYDSLDNHGDRPGIERLMAPAETPLDGPAAPANLPEPRRPDGTPALTQEEIRLLHQQRRAAMQRGDAAEQAMQQLSAAANILPQGAAQGQTSTVKAERLEAPAPAQQVAGAPETDPVAVPIVDVPPASEATPPQIVAAAPSPVVAPTPAETEAAAAVKPAAGAVSRLVQLGAVRSEEAAKAEWARLQKKFPGQLGALDASVTQVDLGARGIYWRVRGGSVNAEQGKKICEALKAAGQSCIVVSR
jgi:hypothetical protein